MQPDNNEHRYQELATKWLDGSITPAEEQEFANWYNAGMDAPLLVPESFAASEEIHRQRLLNKIKADIKEEGVVSTRVIRLRKWIAAAAAILILITTGLYYLLNTNKPASGGGQTTLAHENDVAPGGNRAVLKLANGSQIILDSADNGVLATQGNTSIIKSQSGQLVFDISKQGTGQASVADEAARAASNTLSTPKGGQYVIILPDGTKVWLNAQSSLQFPTAFAAKERIVQLTGEAYFEVARDKHKPFHVQSNGADIEVLGTHFNVMAYTNEPVMEATLLEGAIKVSKGARSETIQPGKQVQLTEQGMHIRNIDTLDAVAWKNGIFQFNDTYLKNIMRQI
jgi:transmembrane sensor